MATLREYFDTDITTLTVHVAWKVGDRSGNNMVAVRARIHQDFDANAKYWSFFIPDTPDSLANVAAALNSDETGRCVLSPAGDSAYVEVRFANYSEAVNSETLKFTGRVFLYIDKLLPVEVRRQITDHGRTKGLYVVVRDTEYATERSRMEKPLAFISHDTRDKDT